ncbi:uncharacterized protein [Aegilops tauschii subsp. strangulata]|uniref:uncharacterized protein n=1 Tax=Aegilops tauschii subsp. strangulata TaxID=200361 RepID=UPI003CC8A457
MSPPQTLKEMQKLAECVTSLGHFISKLSERALPFVKLMKRKGPLEWTTEGEAAFEDLKRYLTSPPVMVAPRLCGPLVLYLAATPHSASATLVAVPEEHAGASAKQGGPQEVAQPLLPQDGAPEDPIASPTCGPPESLASPAERGVPEALTLVEHMVYFVNTVLRDACARYHMQQKLLLALLVASRKLRHYFQGHPIKVVSAYPLEMVLCSPNAARRVAKWNIKFQALQLEFSTTRVIKGAPLDDFMAEWTYAPDLGMDAGQSLTPGSEAPDGWVMHFDGAFARQGTGARVVLISPTEDKLYYVVQLYFQRGEKVSNNITEYKGLIAGLRAAADLGIKCLTIEGDSQLLVNFSNKEYKPKDEHMVAYLEEVRKIEKRFLGSELQHVPRSANKEADDLAKRASRREPQKPGVFEERLFKPTVTPSAVGPALLREEPPPAPASGAPTCDPTSGAHLLLVLEPQVGCWTEELKAYLLHGTLPEKEEGTERVVRQATAYCLQDGELYRRRPNDVSLWCISEGQGPELLADIHGGDCGHNSSSCTLMGKVFHTGF